MKRPDRTLPAAAASVIPPLLGAVVACEAAVRAGDPEAGVHAMRVATKRLREAWRAHRAAFPSRVHRRVFARIERLNDALGVVRDADVAGARLVRLAAEGPPLGLDLVLGAIAAERAAAVPEMLAAIDALDPDDVRARAAAATTAPDPAVAVRRAAARVAARWAAVRASATSDALHEVRKANKRLRYALEATAGAARSDTIALHDALGDVHDADVLRLRVETALLGLPAEVRETWGPLLRRIDARRQEALLAAAAAADRLGSAWAALARRDQR